MLNISLLKPKLHTFKRAYPIYHLQDVRFIPSTELVRKERIKYKPELILVNFLVLLSIAYLFLPIIIFINGYLRKELAFLVDLLIFLSALHLFLKYNMQAQCGKYARKLFRTVKVNWPSLLVAAIITFIWLIFSSIGGVGSLNFDSGIRSSLLWHLTFDNWPVWFSPAYMGESFGYDADKPYVYYFAYYLPAALAGKLLGWKVANLTLFAYSYCGTLLALLLVICNKRLNVFNTIIMLAVISLFGGFDFVVNFIFDLTRDKSETWLTPFFYFSNTRNLFWAPQHCIPTWIMIGILLNRDNFHPALNELFPLSIAAFILWSPLCLIGLLPFLIPHFIKQIKTYSSLSIINFCTLIVAIILTTFILSNDFKFPIHFSIDVLKNYWEVYFYLICVEVIFILPILLHHFKNLDQIEKHFIVTALFSLILIPFIILGTWNDWAIKVSMPSLLIISIFAGRQFISIVKQKSRKFYISVLLLGLSSLTAFEEIVHSARNYQISFDQPPQIRDFGPGYIVSQQLGKSDSHFFKYLAKRSDQTFYNFPSPQLN